MNPTNYRRQVKRDTEDGPGRSPTGVFVTCLSCEQRVFVHETQRPWKCKNCGRLFEQMRLNRGKRRKAAV